MDADTSKLDELVARLRRLDGVGVAIAEEARAELELEARRTAAAGTSPDGVAWKPRKADGQRAMPKAAEALTAVVSGTTRAVITLVLKGPYVFHQKKRPILPNTKKNGVPPKMLAILKAAAARVIARTMGGST